MNPIFPNGVIIIAWKIWSRMFWVICPNLFKKLRHPITKCINDQIISNYKICSADKILSDIPQNLEIRSIFDIRHDWYSVVYGPKFHKIKLPKDWQDYYNRPIILSISLHQQNGQVPCSRAYQPQPLVNIFLFGSPWVWWWTLDEFVISVAWETYSETMTVSFCELKGLDMQ